MIFAVGCGLSPTHFGHSIPDSTGKVIIQCTVEEFDINRNYRVDHAVIGDVKLVLDQLIAKGVRQGSPKREELMEEIEVARKEKMKKYGSEYGMKPSRSMMVLDQLPWKIWSVGRMTQGLILLECLLQNWMESLWAEFKPISIKNVKRRKDSYKH